ncbi:hypothetical protein [Salinibacter phage M31CR41-2]|uniref:Uncharacterized protein n=1 Tax=Salinibacter phage M31CR41-2 TaxID=2681614 RepID=A0A2I6UH73_9CAUD|nr:hypothetical protein FGG68_gp19 [Salinibacter phage M31CR41-2]AUO79301.1 hypothetical protein [Salinibacter phage M31CR41-2]
MPITESTFQIQPESRAEWNGAVAILQQYGYHWGRNDPGPIETCYNKRKRFRHITAYGKSSGWMAGELTHGEYAYPSGAEEPPGGETHTPGRGAHPLIEASTFLGNHRIILSHYSLPQVTRSRIAFDEMIETQAEKWR